jgi:hypothetical protein
MGMVCRFVTHLLRLRFTTLCGEFMGESFAQFRRCLSR